MEGLFYNYFSVGLDAEAAYGFHHLRETKAWAAPSRLINQAWYAYFSCASGWFCCAPPLNTTATLKVSRPARCCLVLLTVDSSCLLLTHPARCRLTLLAAHHHAMSCLHGYHSWLSTVSSNWPMLRGYAWVNDVGRSIVSGVSMRVCWSVCRLGKLWMFYLLLLQSM